MLKRPTAAPVCRYTFTVLNQTLYFVQYVVLDHGKLACYTCPTEDVQVPSMCQHSQGAYDHSIQ